MSALKIGVHFNLKSLLGLGKLMNKKQTLMEQTVALLLLAYTIALVTGELLRDLLNCGGLPQDLAMCLQRPDTPGKRWLLYSGIFILRKQRLRSRQPNGTTLRTVHPSCGVQS